MRLLVFAILMMGGLVLMMEFALVKTAKLQTRAPAPIGMEFVPPAVNWPSGGVGGDPGRSRNDQLRRKAERGGRVDLRHAEAKRAIHRALIRCIQVSLTLLR
jgi:hypothetical protein